ncbi:hypothetical protein F5882DRAFT_385163 [Hyaloscypha sp. PMI_1271]|nr:hypothetical protein F5882DRAFT_385163 [Hyaloscypha sp. PMI_1271]
MYCQPAPSVRKKRVPKKPVSSSSKTATLEAKLDGLVQMLQRSQTAIPEMVRPHDHIQRQNIDSRSVNLFSSMASQARNTPHYDRNNQVNTDYKGLAGAGNSSSMRLGRLEELAQQNLLPSFCGFRQEAQHELNGRLASANGPLTPATSTCSFSTGRDNPSSSIDYLPETEAQLEEYLDSYRTQMVPYLPIVCISPDMTLEKLRKQRHFLFLVIRAICSKNLERQAALVLEVKKGCPKPIIGMIPARTVEERRAVIGLYVVSSVYAIFFQKIELMRWTRYLDECLQVLEDKKEYPTDGVLVYLARGQLICNKGNNSTISDLFSDAELRVPVDFFVKSLKSQLDDLERLIPPELKSNGIPPVQLYFSMIPLTQMGHFLFALFRLSIFESPDVPWDRRRVRQEMNFGDIVQLVVDRWEQVTEANRIEIVPEMAKVTKDGAWSEPSWFHAMKRVLVLQGLWEAKVAAMTAADVDRAGGLKPQESEGINELGGPGMQQMDGMEFGGMNVDLLDDDWIQDMLGGGYDFGF